MADITLTVKVDMARSLRDLDAFKRRQIPFATSRALNEIGRIARAAQTQGMFERFEVRRAPRMRTAVRMKASSKTRLETVLTIRDPHLVQHEEGGVRKPGDVQSAIVQAVAPAQRRRRIIRGSNRPKVILKRSKRAFVATMKSGKTGVFRRRGKKRYPIDLVFAFEKSVKLEPALEFEKTVLRVVERDWDRVFGREFGRAIATGR